MSGTIIFPFIEHLQNFTFQNKKRRCGQISLPFFSARVVKRLYELRLQMAVISNVYFELVTSFLKSFINDVVPIKKGSNLIPTLNCRR